MRITPPKHALALLAALPLALAAGCVVVVDRDDDSARSSFRGTSDRTLGIDLDSPGAATATQAGVERDRVSLITRVREGSRAEIAGLKRYDIITQVDGKDWASPGAVREAARSKRDGETLRLTIRRAGEVFDTDITFAPR